MRRRVRVRPGKEQSIVGVFVGIIFCAIGLFAVIPIFGWFGLFWTLMALIITITNAVNAFSEKGVTSHEITIDDDYEHHANKSPNHLSTEKRLEELQDLLYKGLITQEEYSKKRKEIIDKL